MLIWDGIFLTLFFFIAFMPFKNNSTVKRSWCFVLFRGNSLSRSRPQWPLLNPWEPEVVYLRFTWPQGICLLHLPVTQKSIHFHSDDISIVITGHQYVSFGHPVVKKKFYSKWCGHTTQKHILSSGEFSFLNFRPVFFISIFLATCKITGACRICIK